MTRDVMDRVLVRILGRRHTANTQHHAMKNFPPILLRHFEESDDRKTSLVRGGADHFPTFLYLKDAVI